MPSWIDFSCNAATHLQLAERFRKEIRRVCRMKHSYLADSTAEFIEEVASHLIPKDYFFHAYGLTPEYEAAEETDREILKRIKAGNWQFRIRKNRAELRYLRFNRFLS
jgi:hypothetical protein